ncbi:MAG: lysophospholipid acyltransferase family protein [Lentisphaerae bacterium]|nr:lysophospholipid acyltransferase family protein [Lentisphaerota bacterium]
MQIILKWLPSLGARLSNERAAIWGRRVGWLLGSLLRYRRAEVERTLRRCLPNRSAAAYRALSAGSYENLGRVIMETLQLTQLDRTWLERNVSLEGLEIIRQALSQGRGALMLTAHLGHFQLPAMIACFFEIPITVITKTVKPAILNDYWIQLRRRYQVKAVPHRGSFRACLAALRANEMLGFILDQNMKRHQGIFVDFFGRPACTSPGLALLSAMAGSPVIPVFCTRRPDGHHQITVQPALAPPPDRQPQTIQRATQAYTAIIEAAIREHPEQWTWIHRRWRPQPLALDQAPSGQAPPP